jgi:hypothetical protein
MVMARKAKSPGRIESQKPEKDLVLSGTPKESLPEGQEPNLPAGSLADTRAQKSPAGTVSKIVLATKVFLAFLVGLRSWLAGGVAKALGLGGLGQNVASNLSGIAKAVQMFGFAAGLTLVVMGLLELYNTGRSHDATLKGGVTKCVVGAALLAVDAIISTFSTTIFGGNESGAGLGGLGL